MENPSSPLDTLRQLKEMLDAGALTPTEFDALKQRLVFSDEPAVPPAPVVFGPVVSVPPVAAPPAPEPYPLPFAGVPRSPGGSARANDAESSAGPPAPAFYAAPVPEPLPEPAPNWVANEFLEAADPPARSPLALILSIGGLLALLGLVLYLSMNRPPSEHLSSTSQTAADSLAAPIETGPQAEQVPTPVAAPETIRVAPAHPAPAVLPRRPAPARDSAVASPSAATDSVAAQ